VVVARWPHRGVRQLAGVLPEAFIVLPTRRNQLWQADFRQFETTPKVAACGWVSWFNEEERIHGELDDLTPAEAEADYRHRSQLTAA
jgi:hypothetical protein